MAKSARRGNNSPRAIEPQYGQAGLKIGKACRITLGTDSKHLLRTIAQNG
jgi:hypothetical protein